MTARDRVIYYLSAKLVPQTDFKDSEVLDILAAIKERGGGDYFDTVNGYKVTERLNRFSVWDGDEPIAFISLVQVNDDWRVDAVGTHPDYRKKGLAVSLYLMLVNSGRTFISDRSQTPSGFAVWRKIAASGKAKVIRKWFEDYTEKKARIRNLDKLTPDQLEESTFIMKKA